MDFHALEGIWPVSLPGFGALRSLGHTVFWLDNAESDVYRIVKGAQ